MDQEELSALNDQASALAAQGRFEDAVGLYEMAVRRSSGQIRAKARVALAMTLMEMNQAYAGKTPNFRSMAERNYLRIKDEIQEVLREQPTWWGAQAAAVGAAQTLLYDYQGPRGITGLLASGGGARQLARLSDESFMRLSNELLILVRLGQQALAQDGHLLDMEFVGAGQAALDAADTIDRFGRLVPATVPEFFASIQDDRIETTDDTGELAREVKNVRRLAQMRATRK